EHKLGIKAGSTTADGLFTLEHAECQAACTEAPCLQVNYRYRYRVTPADLDALIDDLSRGRLDGEVPSHGTVARVRQQIPAERAVGAVPPDAVTGAPAWMPPPAEAKA
ncbi:MAG TPA: NAD(P)H-dependent oxidoreductase subunit E, partial [Ilumatobacteraceae bacterium]|nr:NAD(P)H-dependent oxidoreductase subunit E [Ilumatobacteraceae bacterium]